MSRHKYDNEVAPDNVYGHALGLLGRYVTASVPEGIHLDLACGFGRIAEHIVEAFALQYVGVDQDANALSSLRDRGFETHAADLTTRNLLATLDSIAAGRRVVSVTLLDGLEHLVDGAHVLGAIAELTRRDGGVAVVSVPNVTHLDVATKNVLGHWEYTESGLLDRTHVQLYSAASLTTALTDQGLTVLEEYDVVMEHSDQHFPADHVGLSAVTSLGHWLRWLRDEVEPHAVTNQFVWAVTAHKSAVQQLELVPHARAESEATGISSAVPFTTLVMRTRGERPQALREAMLSVAAQSSTDFELLLLAHGASSAALRGINALLADQPSGLRSRTRVVAVDHASTAVALNDALRMARGRYVTLVEEDLLFAHWIELCADQAENFPGRTIRGVALNQWACATSTRRLDGVRGVDAPRSHSGEGFLIEDYTAATPSPAVGFTFPRSVHADLGLMFDESVPTATVRDFLLRAIQLTGVVDLRDVVVIRRRWSATDEQSTPSEEESPEDLEKIRHRIDGKPFLMPAGSVSELRRRRELVREEKWEAQLELAHALHQVVLKQTHIENIEAMLEVERTRVQRLLTTRDTQREQIERLRRRLRPRESATTTDAPPESRVKQLRRAAGSMLRRRESD